MTPERWKKLEEVFESAVQRPPHERAQFLEGACAGDEALRSQVETLLLSYEQAGSFMESPALGSALSETLVDQTTSVIGLRLGAYKIVRELGRGGMGSVYLAVRADDEFHKQVAIKLIKRGMDTDFIIRRFRNERQILASLDDPNIARLIDGGTTEDGLPYFVMEHVEGLPIYHYCDQHRLTIVERLRLFRKVCSAVHYAHQRRVIHRDLKPSNILVTSDGIPKLLDFGIAKLLNPEMAYQTLDPTTAAIRLMTPEYASPEQIRGDIVTVASDVYSLGVMLYELLTDHRPYRLKDYSPQELAHVICEEDPDPPSVAVNLIEVISDDSEPLEITPETVSHARSTTPEQLRRELSGNLDNIVLKALRKEAAKRYGSVDELSEDLRRYLEGHPVSAPSYFPTPETLLVETPLSGTTVHSVAVLPFHVLRVEEKADEFLGMGMADAIITKLSNIQRIMVRPTSSIIKYYDGTHNVLAAGHELNVGYVLDGRIQRAGDRVRVTVQLVRVRDGIPLWAAKFDENFTDIFGVEDSISEQVARALVPRLTGQERERLLKRETANADAYEAFVRGRYFWNKFTAEDFSKALEQFREAIRLDSGFAQAYVGVADYYNWAAIYGIGPPHEYFPLAKTAAATALELDHTLAEAHAALAFSTLCYDWDWEAAESRFKRSLELNPNYAPAHQWYSNALATQGRFEEAIAEIKRAQEINPLSMMDRSIAGWTFYHARQYDLAMEELLKALEMDGNFGNGHLMLAAVYERLGMYEDSIETVQRALELMDGSIMPLWVLGFTLAVSGRRTEAREVIEQLDILSQKRYVSPYYYALIHTGLGDREKAFEWLEKACESRDEWLIWLGTEPKLDELRSDSRFPQLLRRIGLKGDETRRAISYADEHSGNGARTISRSRELPPSRRGSQTGEVSSGTTTRSQGVRARRNRLLMLGAGLTSLIIIIAATLGLYNLLSRPVPHFSRVNLEKLTTSGNVITAAISPDGKHVAYVMDEAGMHGIWVRQVTIANSIRIVPAGDAEIRGLTFSNDGTYLHYVTTGSDGRGVLYQVPALGGFVREVKRGVDSPISFAPDGKQFAFIRSNTTKGEEELLVSDLTTAGEQQLALRKFPEHFSLDTAPAWSPDGKRIACVTQTTDAEGFFMKVSELNLADRKETSLSKKRWLEIGQTAWISDGSGLMITAQDESSAFQHVWLLSYQSGDARRITNDLSDYRGVSLPTNADLLLTVQRQTLTIIWITPREDAENPKQVTSGAGRFFDLTWTPEGKILYSSDASGIADIWEMDADGTGQRQLTADAGRNYTPVASPDGRYIFFHSNRSGAWQIWRMDRDGSNQIQMTSEKEESNWPQVSPDGKWVFYQHVTSGTASIWKLPVEGGTAVRLTTALSMRPSVSPAGQFIAHWQKADAPNAPWQIAITSFEGGEPVKILDIPQSPANANSVIHWSRDGKGVLFIDFRDNVANLMIKPLDEAPARQLSNFTKEQFYSFDIAPDGRMVLSRGLRTNDAVIISEAR